MLDTYKTFGVLFDSSSNTESKEDLPSTTQAKVSSVITLFCSLNCSAVLPQFEHICVGEGDGLAGVVL